MDRRMDTLEDKVDQSAAVVEGNLATMDQRMTALEGKMNEMLEILKKSHILD